MTQPDPNPELIIHVLTDEELLIQVNLGQIQILEIAAESMRTTANKAAAELGTDLDPNVLASYLLGARLLDRFAVQLAAEMKIPE